MSIQEHTSADTSLNQISAGLRYAVRNGLIKPNSVNLDIGGGKFNQGIEYVETCVPSSRLLIYDKYNRSEENNSNVLNKAKFICRYVGIHNTLNVVKEVEVRADILDDAKNFMTSNGVVHITIYEGDKTGNSRQSKQDRGRGSSWQEHRTIESYLAEIKEIFPESAYEIVLKRKNILITQKYRG